LLHAWRREPAAAAEWRNGALATARRTWVCQVQGRAELILRWAEAELAPNFIELRGFRGALESQLGKRARWGEPCNATLFVAMCARLGRAEPALR